MLLDWLGAQLMSDARCGRRPARRLAGCATCARSATQARRSAGRTGSIAERAVPAGLDAPCRGRAAPDGVALDDHGTALAATRLGDLDAASLAAARLCREATSAAILRAGFEEVAGRARRRACADASAAPRRPSRLRRPGRSRPSWTRWRSSRGRA